jgi:hypothetical protein
MSPLCIPNSLPFVSDTGNCCHVIILLSQASEQHIHSSSHPTKYIDLEKVFKIMNKRIPSSVIVQENLQLSVAAEGKKTFPFRHALASIIS